MTEVRNEIVSIIRRTFDYDGPIADDMTTDDVDGWDSLGHVTLILMIERALGIRFAESERDSLANVGELISLARAKALAR